MDKNDLKNLIRLAIQSGDMETARALAEQLKRERDSDFILRLSQAKSLDDFIEIGIFQGDI